MTIQIAYTRFRAHRPTWVPIILLLALSVAAGCPSPEHRRVGETFDMGTVSYTVKGKEVRSQISMGGATMDAGRSASFVLISYLVVNRGKNQVSINPLMLRLVTADHIQYDVDLPATYALRMENVLGGSGETGSGTLNGGGSGAYVAVFRVPDDVAHQKFSIIIRGRAIVAID